MINHISFWLFLSIVFTVFPSRTTDAFDYIEISATEEGRVAIGDIVKGISGSRRKNCKYNRIGVCLNTPFYILLVVGSSPSYDPTIVIIAQLVEQSFDKRW